MTAPVPPPTVAPTPTAPRRRRPWQLAFGVVIIVIALALGFAIARAGFDRLTGDDDAAATTTTTEVATAGLTDADVVPAEPWIVPPVPEPVRGRAEVAGYQGRLVGEEVADDVEWSQDIDGAIVRGTGSAAAQHHVAEQLLTTDLGDTDPDLEALARAWADDLDGELTVRATTVAGQPAWFAHAIGEREGHRTERYVVAFDAGPQPVIAVADAEDVEPDSLQAEWLAFVSSIAPT